MNTRPPRVSNISLHPANQPCYGYWTKIVRPEGAMYDLGVWLKSHSAERVVIGHTWIYFENDKDATFFNLTH